MSNNLSSDPSHGIVMHVTDPWNHMLPLPKRIEGLGIMHSLKILYSFVMIMQPHFSVF